MDLSIMECPSCGAAVVKGEAACSGCGKPLPVEPDATEIRGVTAPDENPCPRCGEMVPKQALRCRDCGAFMNAEVEAAAMAQQANRMFQSGSGPGGFNGPGGFAGGGYQPVAPPNPGMSGFAEVADDDDFDLSTDYGAGGIRLRPFEEQIPASQATPAEEDDFELGDSTADYAVSGEAPTPSAPPVSAPLPDLTEPPAAETAKPAAAAPGAAGSAPAEAATAAAPAARPAPAVDHSVETAGDVLLDAALAEETEASNRSKLGLRKPKRTAITGLAQDRVLVFCPNGHRIQVQDRHRGRTGRCPNCRALFFVPVAETNQTLGQAGGAASTPTAADSADPAADTPIGYTKWLTDVRLHRINPAKLKLVPGSLEGEYESVDLGGSAENLLIAVLFAGSGPFRSMQEPKKKPVARQAMLEHLTARKPIEELPVPKKYVVTPEQLAQFKIVQPAIPGEESLFADVPVFGKGRIAIRVAPADAPNERSYLSFTLSQFRQFSLMLSEVFNLANYGSGTSIPLTDSLVEAKCHYSEAAIHSLSPQGLEYYQADPALKLVVVGRRCEKCGLTVNEDSRKKEKIGGASDASVAKAKCPKCKSKFGSITLYGLPTT